MEGTMNVNHQNYESLKMLSILSNLKSHAYLRMQSAAGLMDLSIDLLDGKGTDYTFSMAHNAIQNGDIMADPDMEIRVNEEMEEAYALTFQNDYMGIFTRCEDDNDLARDLDRFLYEWLNQIKSSNYSFSRLE
jgi:hypothetical protein